mgnify:CR=1 FL=1
MGVRFRAASFLAQRKDKRAEPILREAMNAGGSDGLLARSLLVAMGATMPVDRELPRSDQIDEALASADPLTRLAAVELSLRLPVQQAVQGLEKAARDPDSILRFRVSEALAALLIGGERKAGLRLLQRLLSDEDSAVRASAGLILSHDYETLGRQRGEPPIARRPQQLPPASLSTSPVETPPAADNNGLSEAERRLAAQLMGLIAQSAAAMAKQDFSGAEAALLKAGALCRGQPKASRVCGKNLLRIAFQLAVVHEKQEKWSLAQSEYQRVRDGASTELRAAAKIAITRLSKQLGQLIVWKKVGKACKRVELWMPAGTHKFSDGGQTKSVKLSAGQQVEVRLCKK